MDFKGYQIVKKHCKSTKVKILPRIYMNKQDAELDCKKSNAKRQQYFHRYEVVTIKSCLVF